MAERILITGITGFVGSHMADYVFDEHPGNEIYGLRRYHLSRMDHVRHNIDRIKWVDCNLADPISVRGMMDQVKPDRVFHCAAESFVSPSWNHPTHYMRVNYDCTVNLLDALHQAGSKSPFHIPGSGEEYGEIHESELPIDEQTILRPVNPYAVTKIAQDLIGYVYYKSYGVNVIRTRAFNHEGPRRDKVFGIPWYAYQIAKIENGLQKPHMKVGHLDDKRNFTHVKDMVEAYWLAVDNCIPGELYLIGSENKEDIHTFRECLENLISLSTTNNITYEVVPKFVRPTQVPFLICDSTKFRKLTSWETKIGYRQILTDTLDYWRHQIKSNPP